MSRRHLVTCASIGSFVVLAVGIYWPVLRGEVFVGRDLFRNYMPVSAFLRRSLLDGHLPLWLPDERLGQPFLATLQTQVLYPLRLIPVVLAGPYRGVTIELLLHVVVAFVGTSLAARRLGATAASAAVAGICFSLGPVMTHLCEVSINHNALAWSGFHLACALALARRPTLRRAAELAVVSAASLLCGAPEMTLIQGMIALVVTGAVGYRRSVADRAGACARLLASCAWGGMLASATLLPAAEHIGFTDRGAGTHNQLAWSATSLDLFSILWPLANSPPADGHEQLFPVLYAGVFVVTSAGFALAGRAARRRLLPLALIGVFFLFLSPGAGFLPAERVLGLFPFSLFRYPVKYALGAIFLLFPVAACGLDRIAALARRGRLRGAVSGRLVLAIACGLAGGVPFARMALREEALMGLLLVGLMCGLGLLLLRRVGTSPARARHVPMVLGAVIVADVLLSQQLFELPIHIPAEELAIPSRVARAVSSRGGGRVSVSDDVIYEKGEVVDESTHDVARRYIRAARDMLIPERHLEDGVRLFEGYGSPEPTAMATLLSSITSRSTYDFGGVRWLVRRRPPKEEGLIELPFENPDPGMPPVRLFENPFALPRAFVVHQARQASDEEAISALRARDEPFRRVAYLAAPLSPPLPDAACADSSATVRDDGPNALEILVEACAEGILIVTDT